MTERILIIAEHRHIADLWMRLNLEPLQVQEGECRIFTSGDPDHVRGIQSHRLIIIGHPREDMVELATHGCRLNPAKVLRVSHVDRLAAGWRDA